MKTCALRAPDLFKDVNNSPTLYWKIIPYIENSILVSMPKNPKNCLQRSVVMSTAFIIYSIIYFVLKEKRNFEENDYEKGSKLRDFREPVKDQ